MTRVALTYERLCRIVLMVFVVNVAMLVHTLMGLILGGFFPSIAAAYATFRTWLIDEDQSSNMDGVSPRVERRTHPGQSLRLGATAHWPRPGVGLLPGELERPGWSDRRWSLGPSALAQPCVLDRGSAVMVSTCEFR